jgi:hypothetical protein
MHKPDTTGQVGVCEGGLGGVNKDNQAVLQEATATKWWQQRIVTGVQLRCWGGWGCASSTDALNSLKSIDFGIQNSGPTYPSTLTDATNTSIVSS